MHLVLVIHCNIVFKNNKVDNSKIIIMHMILTNANNSLRMDNSSEFSGSAALGLFPFPIAFRYFFLASNTLLQWENS